MSTILVMDQNPMNLRFVHQLIETDGMNPQKGNLQDWTLMASQADSFDAITVGGSFEHDFGVDTRECVRAIVKAGLSDKLLIVTPDNIGWPTFKAELEVQGLKAPDAVFTPSTGYNILDKLHQIVDGPLASPKPPAKGSKSGLGTPEGP